MNAKTVKPVRCRYWIRSDLPALSKIEADSFPAENCWPLGLFKDQIMKPNCVGLIAERAALRPDVSEVFGFVVFELWKGRIDVVNLAVAPRWRRQGVASKLVDVIKQRAGLSRPVVETLVTESNLEAQLFFRAAGFICDRILEQPWLRGEEDAYRFTFDTRKDHDHDRQGFSE